MTDGERDSRLHKALRSLPDRRAPNTLLPRVLAAIDVQEPQWSGAWWTWPAPARWAFMLAVAGAAALSLKAGMDLWAAGARVSSAVRALVGGFWTVSRVFWTIGGPALQALAAVMAAACAAFATGLVRLAHLGGEGK